jgi:putative transposase
MYESSKCAPQQALRDLDKAFENFFRRCKQGVGKKGFPRFKSKKKGLGSFKLEGTIRVSETQIQLPKLGTIRLKERGYLPKSGVKIMSATVSEKAGRWFVSLQVEEDILVPEKAPCVLGVDVGVSRLAVTSDGAVYENPRALAGLQRKLRSKQKAVSRKKKGSNNRKKAVAELAKLHYRIANIRRDAIHKMTTAIVKQASEIVIEDLNVAGMLKNHKLARALSDASLSEIHRQLEYKSKWYGAKLVRADRFFPSTKTCSGCGNVRDVALRERTYCCDKCGLTIDRDLNAAINLKFLAGSSPVAAYRPRSYDLKASSDETLVG